MAAIIPRLPDRAVYDSPCTSTLERPQDATDTTQVSELPWASGASRRLFYAVWERRSLKTQQRLRRDLSDLRLRLRCRLRGRPALPDGRFDSRLRRTNLSQPARAGL